jgi:hypothetical protein
VDSEQLSAWKETGMWEGVWGTWGMYGVLCVRCMWILTEALLVCCCDQPSPLLQESLLEVLRRSLLLPSQ